VRIALAVALVLVVTAVRAGAGERPWHHTDDGFRNLDPVEHAGPLVTVPFFFRRAVTSLLGRSGAPAAVANDGAWLRENARHSVPSVTWIGHATVLVQLDHVTLLTDPIWSDRASPFDWVGPRRYVPPPIAIDALPVVDAVLVSHNHYDHLDTATLRQLAARGTRFLVPLGNGTLLRAEGIGPVEELDWWQSVDVRGVTVTCVPARHWSRRGMTDMNRALWASWAAVGPSRRFYFGGDTGYQRAFDDIGSRLGPFDLAALPIGAYEPVAMMRPVHMNPEEAVTAGLALGAARVLGVHWGTFDLTDEPFDEPPERFHAEGARRGLASDRLWTPAPGETRPF
jgi:N-acyl-phosphatidylethanolamine-hydrolysing phospholipase D